MNLHLFSCPGFTNIRGTNIVCVCVCASVCLPLGKAVVLFHAKREATYPQDMGYWWGVEDGSDEGMVATPTPFHPMVNFSIPNMQLCARVRALFFHYSLSCMTSWPMSHLSPIYWGRFRLRHTVRCEDVKVRILPSSRSPTLPGSMAHQYTLTLPRLSRCTRVFSCLLWKASPHQWKPSDFSLGLSYPYLLPETICQLG